MFRLFLVLTAVLSSQIAFAESRNRGLHLELDVNSSALTLPNIDKVGFFVTPEARFKIGFDSGHGIFVGAGYKQFSQFTDDKPDSSIIEDKDKTEHNFTVGYTFNLTEQTNNDTFTLGFDSFVFGAGVGTFRVSDNNFVSDKFVFLGFTLSVVDLWIVKP